MSIINRIKYDGPKDGSQWLIYKCLSEKFVLGSQLIVNQGQEVLFYRGGEALDLFGPGTHTLCTGNLPILAQLVNLPFGGKTPFTAEIYYINKTSKLDIKWGTSTPIPLEDPKYKIILNIGARGQYGISIMNSRLFVSRIIGAVPNGTTISYLHILKYFNGLINSKIKSVTADYLLNKGISFLEITQYLSELSDLFQVAINNEFRRFGIELVNFFCESIAPQKGEYQKLQSYKEELALGLDFYQQRRSLDILQKVAENSSIGNQFISKSGSEKNNSQKTKEVKKLVKCLICNSYCKSDQTYCNNCGSKLEKLISCPNCKKEIDSKMKFCGYCGQKILFQKEDE